MIQLIWNCLFGAPSFKSGIKNASSIYVILMLNPTLVGNKIILIIDTMTNIGARGSPTVRGLTWLPLVKVLAFIRSKSPFASYLNLRKVYLLDSIFGVWCNVLTVCYSSFLCAIVEICRGCGNSWVCGCVWLLLISVLSRLTWLARLTWLGYCSSTVSCDGVFARVSCSYILCMLDA